MSKHGIMLCGLGLAACVVVVGGAAVQAAETAPRPVVADFTGEAKYQCRADADGGGTLVEHSRTAEVEGGITYLHFTHETGHTWDDAHGNRLTGRVVRTTEDREGNPLVLFFDVSKGVTSTARPAPTPTSAAPGMADAVTVRMRVTKGRETLTGPCEPLTSAQLLQRGTTIVRTMPFEGQFRFTAE